jgi:hypothetical protein
MSLPKERFSKKSFSTFAFDQLYKNISCHKIDTNSGTHQYLKMFNASIVSAINTITEKSTDENWNDQMEAEKCIYSLINKIVGYGKKEMLGSIIREFDLKYK